MSDWIQSADNKETIREDSDAVIRRQAVEIERLRAALKPFASLLDRWKKDADTPPLRKGQATIEMCIRISDLERAKRTHG